ncbi:MAG: PKD domain-containing protein [Putridiphycobacter sp.]
MLTTKRVLGLLFFIVFNTTFAQQDTLFWFAAPDVSSAVGDTPIKLNFSTYAQSSDVVISQPANSAFAPILVSIPANSISVVDLTPFLTDVESHGADMVDTTGIKITATNPVSVNYSLEVNGNREIFSLKGTKGLGDEFYTPFQKYWDNASVSPSTFSSIEIVATVDNTTILVTPRTDVVGHAVDATFSQVLNEGETFSVRDVNLSAATSLAGSIISSNQPVSVTVFSGALDNAGCSSTVGEQLVSKAYLGKDFIVHKTTATDERIYVLATENSTNINITNSGSTSTLINWGETYELALTDAINFIETSKPVYVFQVSGNGCNLGGTQLPAVSCNGKSEQAFNRISGDSLGLMVYVRTAYTNDFQINGSTTLLQSSDFTVVPGTSGDYSVALKYFSTADIVVGTYNLITNTSDIFGLGVVNGESGNGSAFSFVSEFASYPFVNAGIDGTVCANSTFSLNGLIGGGDVDITWGSSGFGSFTSGLTALNNTYEPSDLDTLISPLEIVLSSNGICPQVKDTLFLTVTPSPLVNASVDQIVCENNAVVQLNGSVSGGASTGLWSKSGTGSFVSSNTDLAANYIPSNTDITNGSVTLVLESTSMGSCQLEKDTMMVQITPAPIVDAGVDTILVCSNNPNFSILGTVSGGTTTGKWITTGNGLFSPNNLSLNADYTPSPNDIASGEIMIFLQSTNNGDCFPVEDSIVVIFTDEPDVEAGANIVSCTNAPEVVLNGSVSGPTSTGVWSNGNGLFSVDSTDLSATYTPTASEISSGTVTLILASTNNGGCNAENDQVQISFVAPPFANFNFNEICEGNQTDFTDFSLNGAGSIVNWSWDFGDTQVGSTQNPSNTYAGNGTYPVELIVESDFGCFDTVVKNVNVFEVPQANFDYNADCPNDQVIIQFNDQSSISNGSILTWFYDFGGSGSQSVQNPLQLFNGTGNYTITQIVTSDQGCKDTIKQVINVPARPEAGFLYSSGNAQNIGSEFIFTDTSLNSVDWYWNFGNGEEAITQDASTFYFENGTYTVMQIVENSFGCLDSASVNININKVVTEINQLIPNAISPNGDGKNDVWKLEFIELLNPQAEIIIVNRWGQTIFESVGYSDPWDGTYNGEEIPEGTYYYIIKVSDSEIYEGTILVLKSANN